MLNIYLDTPSAGAAEHARVGALAPMGGVIGTAFGPWLDCAAEFTLPRPEASGLTNLPIFVPTAGRQGTAVSSTAFAANSTKRTRLFMTRGGQRFTARPG